MDAMPLKNGALTQMEQAFVEVYGATGERTAAARLAGYRQPEILGHQLLARPAVRQAAETALLEGLRAGVLEGVPILRKLQAEAVKDSDKIAAAARLQDFYGRVLDRLGGAAEKDLHEMSAAELRTQLADVERAIAKREAVDVEPETSLFD
jgi:hypothetical protein